MKEQRFHCTACGKCCHGWLPLTIDDALANAGRFPLAMAWTPVRKGSRSFNLTAKLGAMAQLPNRQQVAVLVQPTSYLPPSFPCPALTPDNLCAIHDSKPIRCRAMPFYAYREENDQTDLLVPRKEWQCDTTKVAPVVYRNRQILDRADFENERKKLEADAPALRAYITTTLKQNAAIMSLLVNAAMNPVAGSFIVSFSSFLRRHKQEDLVSFAKKQYPVLAAYEKNTEGALDLSDYHKYYQAAAEELRWFAERA